MFLTLEQDTAGGDLDREERTVLAALARLDLDRAFFFNFRAERDQCVGGKVGVEIPGIFSE